MRSRPIQMGTYVRVNGTEVETEGSPQVRFAPRAIARELDLAPATVDYHLAGSLTMTRHPSGKAEPPLPQSVATRARVAELLAEGLRVRRSHARLLSGAQHQRAPAASGRAVCARYDCTPRSSTRQRARRRAHAAFGSGRGWPRRATRASSARPSGTPIEQLLVADTYRGRYLPQRAARRSRPDGESQ